jgi:hypothetical protein
MTIYLFSDIYEKFHRFFSVDSIFESKFLYDIAFGFMPRKFDCSPTSDDRIIYDEEDDVPEMYFITEGTFGVGFSMNANGCTKPNYHISKKEHAPQVICDHYVVNNIKCEFIYMAIDFDVTCLALSQNFLNSRVFPKYPDIAQKIREESKKMYMRNIYNSVHQDRLNKIDEMNLMSVYKKVKLEEKENKCVNSQDQEINKYNELF